MHVADVTLFFAPHSGGVKRYLMAKHAFLSAQPGMRHSLLVPSARTSTTDCGIHMLKSAPLAAGGYRVPLRPDRWRALLNELAPDVIEAGDPYHLAWMAIDAARDLGIPAVAFAHSDLARVLGSRFGRGIGALTDRYLRLLYSRFDLVLAPSRIIAQRLEALGLDNVDVQPLGVDSATFHPDRRNPRLREELGLAPETRLLIFAGRLGREKQIPQLVEAFASLGSPYHLLIVGGPSSASLAPNVTLLPYEQDATRLASLLASADALVHAGLHETFGLVLVEAMACGRPVIAMRSGAIGEHVDDEVGVLAEPGDVRALRAAIEALYTRDWQAMGWRARERVERSYAWRRVFAAQIERYRVLAGHRIAASAPADVPSVP
ncbi:MAG TPA: glycosyltransferase [Rudaea sp.]|nr:glycosyltransferase [Rudaea sp.]